MTHTKALPVLSQSDIDRFWQKVTIGLPDECWLWRASADKNGYGQFRHRNQMLRAHRVAYLMSTGTDPGNSLVLHGCDTPACVNPSHLLAGTNDQNMADMVSKGRQAQPKGETNGQAVLTEEQIRNIRSTPHYRGYGRDLSQSLNVSATTISQIVHGTRWAHVPA